MTKEELRKEATTTVEWECTPMIDRPIFINGYITSAGPREKRIAELEKENAELKADNDARKFAMVMSEKVEKQLREENAELKAKVGLSIDCEKAQKNGELCLGYGGDEDEPCERCKNCIKCECGYYQLGETEKDEQLTKAKEIIRQIVIVSNLKTEKEEMLPTELFFRAENFLKEG